MCNLPDTLRTERRNGTLDQQGQSKYIAFIDECGDHSLTKIDRDFPLFVLSLVLVKRNDYSETILPAINRLKLRYWDHEGVNLHSHDIRKAEAAIQYTAELRPTKAVHGGIGRTDELPAV
ncbi:MAG TPA: DUF3800 domain-containing protein [Phycisphaerae bacterium]|nr:DUF3800 domain-containing protein [Phycisphaerae bacterium]